MLIDLKKEPQTVGERCCKRRWSCCGPQQKPYILPDITLQIDRNLGRGSSYELRRRWSYHLRRIEEERRMRNMGFWNNVYGVVKRDISGTVYGSLGGAARVAVLNVIPGWGQVAYGSAMLMGGVIGGVVGSVRAGIYTNW